MRVSLKATYGIMAALDMALREPRDIPVQSKAIARRQGIPVRFLEQVLHTMKQAGLVESVRGAQGGYVLQRKPAEITLAEMLNALDGTLGSSREAAGNGDGHRSVRTSKADDLLGDVWDRVRQAEVAVLSAVSLQDLVDRYHKLEQKRALMYHI